MLSLELLFPDVLSFPVLVLFLFLFFVSGERDRLLSSTAIGLSGGSSSSLSFVVGEPIGTSISHTTADGAASLSDTMDTMSELIREFVRLFPFPGGVICLFSRFYSCDVVASGV